MASLEERKKLRLLFMEQAYKQTDGDTRRWTELTSIAPAIGLSNEEATPIAQYLVDRGLLEPVTDQGWVIRLTHKGVVEYEQAHAEPDKPTPNLPAINVVHAQTIIGSQLQQGTVGSSQHTAQSVSVDESAEIKTFVAAVKARSAQLGLDLDAQSDLDSQIETIEAQLKSPRPNRTVLTTAGKILFAVLTSATGGAALELVQQAPSLFR